MTRTISLSLKLVVVAVVLAISMATLFGQAPIPVQGQRGAQGQRGQGQQGQGQGQRGQGARGGHPLGGPVIRDHALRAGPDAAGAREGTRVGGTP